MKNFLLGAVVTLGLFTFFNFKKVSGGCEFYFYAIVAGDTCYVSEVEFCKGSTVYGGVEGLFQRIQKRNLRVDSQNLRKQYKTYEFSNGVYTRGSDEEKHAKKYLEELRNDFMQNCRKSNLPVVLLN